MASIVRQKCTSAAPGPSGLTMEHILPIIEDPTDPCFVGLCRLILVIINGLTGPNLRELLTTSLILPLSKPSGGLRPIAMGETIVKLASSYMLSTSFPLISEFFYKTGIQFGIGIQGGQQSAILALQAALELIPESILLKVDISNAFNSISRKHILEYCFNLPQFNPLWRLIHWN